jgi:hypothetical protein
VVIREQKDGWPAVLDRRRLEISDPAIPGSKQPYHTAGKLPAIQAAALIDRCRKSTWSLAYRGIEEICRTHEVARCGLLFAAGRPLPPLDAILASHALIHAAEGEFFRNAIQEASRDLAVPVRTVKEKELLDVCSRELVLSPAELSQRLADWGRALGPPWRQDQKYAALAAWLALTTSRRDTETV